MSFEMNNIGYDGDRKLNTLGRIAGLDPNKNIAKYAYNPVPYNIGFTLNVMVKNAEDGTKILEQILPYFTPDWTTTIKIIDDPEVLIDIPVILNSINQTDTWEGSFEQRRYLVWTLTFAMKGYLFGPVKRGKIIKTSRTDLSFDPFQSTPDLANTFATKTKYASVTVTPGLLANGSPTSNADLTLPYSDIDWEDDYGFVIVEETFPNGVES
jgi:hypothetical protein